MTGIKGDKEKGIVLLLALAVIVILSVVVLEFNYLTRINLDIAYNFRDGLKSYCLAKSAVNFAIALLRDDDDFSYDCLKDDWAQKMPSVSMFAGEISLRAVDAESRININNINSNGAGKVKQQIEKLLSLLGRDKLITESIEEGIPFQTITQFTKDTDLLEYLTVYGDGKVNINTAPRQVLEALSPLMSRGVAQNIVDFREDNPFEEITQLSPAYEYEKPRGITEEIYGDIKDSITVRSHLFLVGAQARINNINCNIDTVIRRDGKICRIIYWKES